MAADATHNQSATGNYKVQGGNNWKIGGSVEILAAGQFAQYIETGSTSTALKNHGISTVTNSSAGGNNIYTIDAPAAGVMKYIACLMADSTDKVSVDFAASGATIAGKTGQTLNQIVFATSGAANNPAGGITLAGLSTSQWLILSSFGTVGSTS